MITDKAGLARSLTEYDPYGKISRFEKYGDKIKNGWQYFSNKPFDDESGLIYFGARYYDPSLGRFITADTIVQAPHDPQTLNRYSYCGNNPINRIDLDGHSWFSKLIKSIQKFFGAVNKVIDKGIEKLEEVTHSQWSFGYTEAKVTVQFGDTSGGTASRGSYSGSGTNSSSYSDASNGSSVAAESVPFGNPYYAEMSLINSFPNINLENLYFDRGVDPFASQFIGGSLGLMGLKGMGASRLALKFGGEGLDNLGLSFTKTAGSNKLYLPGKLNSLRIPGLEQGKGFSPRSVKLPVVKTIGWALTVSAIAVHGKEAYRSWEKNDILNVIRQGSLIVANMASFVPILGYLGLGAEAVDVATYQYGMWLYDPRRRYE